MLAAIDGHAKNFSIHIDAAGAFRLTPLYDIMSAYPLSAGLQRRYFLNTAKAVNYSVQRTEQILDDMLMKMESVIEEVSKKLPSKFLRKISQPIFDGLLSARNELTS